MRQLMYINDKEYKLSREEERTLLKKYKEGGDINARNKLVVSLMPMIARYIAKGFTEVGTTPMPVTKEDLIHEGCLGVIKAIDEYDLKYSTRLVSYAMYKIRFRTFKCFLENRIQASAKYNCRVMKARRSILDSRLADEYIDYDSLPKTLGVSSNCVTIACSLLRPRDTSLDACVRGGTATYHAVTPGKDYFEEYFHDDTLRAFRQYVEDFKEEVPEKYFKILKGRHLKGLSYKELSAELSISRQRIEQLNKVVVEKFKKFVLNHKNPLTI